MESTAQYWKPVWGALERYWKPARQQRAGAAKLSGTLHLCQAKSNRGPRGRKSDFADGERMVKRFVAEELVLSFVPDPEQRLWRTVTRRRHQLTRDKIRFQNQLEALLEQAHIKLSSLVSDLSGGECAADVEGDCGRGGRPDRASGAGRWPTARHARTTARRARRLYATPWCIPSAAEDGAGGVEVDGRAARAVGSRRPRSCSSIIRTRSSE